MATGLVRLICPNLLCRSMLSVSESMRGKEVICKACGNRVVVPLKSKESNPLAVVPPKEEKSS